MKRPPHEGLFPGASPDFSQSHTPEKAAWHEDYLWIPVAGGRLKPALRLYPATGKSRQAGGPSAGGKRLDKAIIANAMLIIAYLSAQYAEGTP